VTLDLDRDGRPDLIQTADPVTGRVWDETASPHWKVFLNEGPGFAAQATLWAVPPSGTSGGFFRVSATRVGGTWTLLDLDGDERLDLVQTEDPTTSEVWDAEGSPHWKVFAGGPAGFAATSTKWTVPPSGLPDGFWVAASDAPAREWKVLDLDGDGSLDLVQSGDTSHGYRVWDATGTPYWKLFRGDGDGFAVEPYRWPVPDSGTAEGFYAVDDEDGSASCWFTRDVDGDRRPDLIQTMDPATSRVWDATGTPYWKVFRGRK
jgi:hypothetical protein